MRRPGLRVPRTPQDRRVREINLATWRGLQVHLRLAGGEAIRITKARTLKGQTQAQSLATGNWHNVLTTDTIEIEGRAKF